MLVAFSMMGTGGTSGRRPEGSPERSIKAPVDRKEKEGVNGKRESSLALQTFVASTLSGDIIASVAKYIQIG